MEEDAPPPPQDSLPGGESLQQTSALSTANQLTFPSVLNYLHGEWRRFERESSEWDLEKADMQARIAFLEGENRGFEVLKSDLLRRVKMLEYALKMERAKHLAEKGSAATGETQAKSSDVTKELSPSAPSDTSSINGQRFVSYPSESIGKSMTLNKGRFGSSKTRDILKAYLQEVGYAEGDMSFNNPSNGAFSSSWTTRKYDTYSAATSRKDSFQQDPTATRGSAFTSVFQLPQEQPKAEIMNAAVITSPTDSIPEEPAAVTSRKNSAANRRQRKQISDSVVYETNDDGDMPDDLKALDNEISQAAAGNVKHPEINKKTMKNWATAFSQGNNGQNTILQKPASVTLTPKSSNASVSSSISDMDSELAGLKMTSGDEDESQSPRSKDIWSGGDTSASAKLAVAETRLWRPRFSLRSHFDSVRAIAFHPNDMCMLSAAEDGTVKYWNMESVVAMRKPPADIEPIFTFRGHTSAVTSLAIGTLIPPAADGDIEERMQFGSCYSAGFDGTIRPWGLPEKILPIYSSYNHKQRAVAKLTGHTDIVWDLKLHPLRPLLLSCSADGTIRYWDLNAMVSDADPAQKVCDYNGFMSSGASIEAGTPTPTSIDFVHTDLTKMIASFDNSEIKLFDIETGKDIVSIFDKANESYDQTKSTQINRVITHQTMAVAVTAHEDRHIRYFDTRSGKRTQTMVAHLDSVSSLDFSPNGLVLVSGGHDASVRLWDVSSHACLQEFSAHRKKFDEAIHCVQFHPRTISGLGGSGGSSTSPQGGSGWLATGGSDSCARLYSCS